MKVVVFLVVALLNLTFAVAGVNYPQPVGFINDFADIIPDAQEQQMEKFLRDYEKKTTVEIAVVTTKSLSGLSVEKWSIELANKWGIGKKDKDNGVLLVVAPNEREYRIEVGYGLEGQLTDSIAGQLGRDYLISAFKAGDYAGGINSLLQAIVAKLGEYSVDQRKELLVQYKKNQELLLQQKKERERNFFVGTMLTTIGLIVLGLMWFLFKKFSDYVAEIKRKRELKQKVLANTEDLLKQTENIGQDFDKIVLAKSNLPQWAQNNVDKASQRFLDGVQDMYNLADSIKEIVSSDPDRASERGHYLESQLSVLRGLVSTAKSQFVKVETEHKRVEEILESFPVKFNKAKEAVESAIKQGFRFSEVDLTELHIRYEVLRERVALNERGATDEIREIANETDVLMSSLHKQHEVVTNAIFVHSRIKSELPKIREEIHGLIMQVDEYAGILSHIESQQPEEVWGSLSRNFATGISEIKSVNLEEITNLNSMESQQFERAELLLDEVHDKISTVKRLFAEVEQLQTEIQSAIDTYPELLRKATKKVERATEIVQKSDVGSDAESIAKKANTKLREAESMLQKELINWVTLVILLTSVIEFAKEAINKAEDDIAEAESARRRRRRRVASSSAYASGSSFGSSSSSGGSFGGGSFGGGGASGSW
jgi:uncharacterized membrane protein YgcG